jgi:hypothetical protein
VSKNLWKFLFLIGGLSFSAMAQDPYHYTNESGIRDKRNIAILSYGSLVNNPAPNDGRPALQIENGFQPTNINLPVAFTRQSSKGQQNARITAVVDNKLGIPKQVYYTTSSFHYLPNARNNLAGREGVSLKQQKYDLNNIFYMKKLLGNAQPDSNETIIQGKWVIRNSTSTRVQLTKDQAETLASWADENGFSAITWASFPPNYNSLQAVAKDLINNPTLLKKTQEYVSILPGGAQTKFEKAILKGKSELKSFL